MLILVTIFSIAGCGYSATTPVTSGPPVKKADAKPAKEVFVENVNRYADSGDADSSIMGLKDNLEQMKKEGVTVSDELTKAVDDLVNSQGAGAVKANAQNVLKLVP